MNLNKLGFNKELEQYCLKQGIDQHNVGRIISEHKERYIVKAVSSDYEAAVMGKLVFNASDRSDFPATGDWVELQLHDHNLATIISILPRSSTLKRKAAGKQSEMQIIAANIDYGLIVQAIDRDFSVNRIERYLAICHDSGIKPIVVLSKVDLISQDFLSSIIDEVSTRIKNTPLIPISNSRQTGYSELTPLIKQGKTYCLLGSSGVGKSTLLNNLAGANHMETGNIGKKADRGKHVTTHRELIVLPSGGIIIDNPGMRELGIGNVDEALKTTFNDIADLAGDCRFRDCKHIQEKGCAVLNAIESGDIDESLYENYQRMQRESTHYQSSVAERRQKGKNLAKRIKKAKQDKRVR